MNLSSGPSNHNLPAARAAAGPADAPALPRSKRAAGAVFTLLVHLLIIVGLLLHRTPQKLPTGSESKVVINLLPLSQDKPAAKPPAPTPTASPLPRPKPQPSAQPTPRPRPTAPPDIFVPPPEVPPPPAPPPAINVEPPMDMQSFINKKRRERELAEQAPAPGAAAPSAPSAGDIAMANINRNLQSLTGGRPGTSGVFQILSKGQREARFAFNGWTPGIGNSWREVVDVDAGLGGDVELAIIRKMIEMIRGHYKGDFNWQSHRLNRVVVMSARPQDNAELEAFLMREFFEVRR